MTLHQIIVYFTRLYKGSELWLTPTRRYCLFIPTEVPMVPLLEYVAPLHLHKLKYTLAVLAHEIVRGK